MPKVCEETWTSEWSDTLKATIVCRSDGDVVAEVCTLLDSDGEHAKLIEHAPAMARLLLKISKGCDVCGTCVMCGADKYRDKVSFEHYPDCEIMSILLAAQVIE